ncbi:MAG: ornithine carbamoyltransferase [Planctomycetaceae bacterium]|nr:ornithine carbamoyltransferase [Planctomycetaceae bacterium]
MSTQSLPKIPRPPTKDMLAITPLGGGDIDNVFALTADMKRNKAAYRRVLDGKRLAMLFEKESLRTRFTFDLGMQDLGGSAVFLEHRHARLGSRESIPDIARNLERWVDGIVARVYKHRHVEDLAQNAKIPVINGLSDLMHPCQALADFFTLHEKWGSVKGRLVAYVGDGNNTCHSLIQVAARLGAHINVCTPEGYEPNSRILNESMVVARETGSEIRILESADEGVVGADAVYTDVWASMGQEGEIEERAAVFHDYQVDEDLMGKAKTDALFMHCLPAHRGSEVTTAVMDSPASVVFDIAENRLHVQKALMAMLLCER